MIIANDVTQTFSKNYARPIWNNWMDMEKINTAKKLEKQYKRILTIHHQKYILYHEEHKQMQ